MDRLIARQRSNYKARGDNWQVFASRRVVAIALDASCTLEEANANVAQWPGSPGKTCMGIRRAGKRFRVLLNALLYRADQLREFLMLVARGFTDISYNS